MAERNSKPVSVNFATLQLIFDWALRLGPVAAFALQFYMSSDKTVDRSRTNDKRITDLENELHILERELGKANIEASALKQHVDDQEKYYVLISAKH